MESTPISFIFFKVPSTAAARAFTFFKSVQSTDSHLFPRTDEELYRFATEGALFGIKRSDSDEFVGLCYAVFNENDAEFEIGGLIVAPTAKKLGLGTILTRFAVAHVIANERPWHYKREIISHIHESNDAPRSIFARSWFTFLGKEIVPEEHAPPSMKRNADGQLVGDKFLFPRSSVPALSKWLDEEFNGTLRDGSVIAIELPPAGLDGLRGALREEIRDLAAGE
jgi:ribosomal protein S18 acetylase RimI-like enzyme